MRTQKMYSKKDFPSNVLKFGVLLMILFTNFSIALAQKNEMNLEVKKEVKWFTDARFGMFIHWTPLGAVNQEIGWSWGREISAKVVQRMESI